MKIHWLLLIAAFSLNGCTTPNPGVKPDSTAELPKNAAVARTTTADYLASCSAAMAKKAVVFKELYPNVPSEFEAATGHYYRLSCALSSPVETQVRFKQYMDKQYAALVAAAKTCQVDSRCIARFIENLDGQLLHCAAYQKQNADLIRTTEEAIPAVCNTAPAFDK